MIFDVAIRDSAGGTCVQEVSLPVKSGLNPVLWWTMESGPATGPKADVIEGVNLTRVQGNSALFTNETGIIGNSWQLRALDVGGQHPASVDTPTTPFVNFTDVGVSIVWWTYWNTLAVSSGSGIRYLFRAVGVDHVIQVYQWPANTKVFFDFVEVLSVPILSQNVWHFMSMRYDNTANTLILDIDQAAQYTAIMAPIGTGVYSTAQLHLEADVSGAGGLNMRFDEVAFFQEVLTNDQLNEIYNGGAGITWP